MSATTNTARRLLERTGEHHVISLFFDLDPEQFAAPPARASQARALIDELNGLVQRLPGLEHDDKLALDEDIARLTDYLNSDDLPVSGAGALAIYASGRDDLFETVQLPDPVASRVLIGRTPHIEPLVGGHDPGRICAVLVSRRDGLIFSGPAAALRQTASHHDDVHGQHSRGGWAQANYERSYEQDTDAHLKGVAHDVFRLWQQRPFQALFVGGPEEMAGRFAPMLHSDLQPLLRDERLSVDLSAATVADVREAVAALVADEQTGEHGELLEELKSRRAGDQGAVWGVAETLEALTERRVETLLLSRDFHGAGARCPNDGMLLPEGTTTCPADGAATEPIEDLREAAVEAAVLQDAAVVAFDQPQEELPPAHPIAALLRF